MVGLTRPRFWHPNRAIGRLLIGLCAGVCVYVLANRFFSKDLSAVAAWDAVASVLIVLSWRSILSSTSEKVRQRAAQEDPGARVVWVLVIAACFVALFSTFFALHHERIAQEGIETWTLFLSFFAVFSAWFLVHTYYALRYAHRYYQSHRPTHALEFPGDVEPSEMDFAYFSFTIGMTFQTSDVSIHSASLRRLVLGHAVLSFFFNTMILAFAINALVLLFSKNV